MVPSLMTCLLGNGVERRLYYIIAYHSDRRIESTGLGEAYRCHFEGCIKIERWFGLEVSYVYYYHYTFHIFLFEAFMYYIFPACGSRIHAYTNSSLFLFICYGVGDRWNSMVGGETGHSRLGFKPVELETSSILYNVYW